jgi:hypothetical protein
MLKQNSSAAVRKGRATLISKSSVDMRAQSLPAEKRGGKAKGASPTIDFVPSPSLSRKGGKATRHSQTNKTMPSPSSTATKRGRTIRISKPMRVMSGQSKRASADGANFRLTPIPKKSRPISSRRKAGAETTITSATSTAMSPQSSSAAIKPSLPNGGMRRNARATRLPSPILIVSEDPFPGHTAAVTQQTCAGTGDVHASFDTQPTNDIANLIDQVKEQWRRRQMWHRAEKSLTLQAKAMCRRIMAGDKGEAEKLYKSAMNGQDHEHAALAFLAMAPLLDARTVIERSRKEVEKQLTKCGKDLPAAKWIEALHGVGFLSFAGIVGEAGDLSLYSNPAKLWKRMGLAVINGGRQRKVSGEEALEHGYSPTRRSLMWTIGDCIIKVGGPYREVYDKRKAYEQEKNERGEYAERAARQLKEKSYDKKTEAFKCYSVGKIPPAQIHMSAKRYMEKRLLRDLWRAWRDQWETDTQKLSVSPTFLPH